MSTPWIYYYSKIQGTNVPRSPNVWLAQTSIAGSAGGGDFLRPTGGDGDFSGKLNVSFAAGRPSKIARSRTTAGRRDDVPPQRRLQRVSTKDSGQKARRSPNVWLAQTSIAGSTGGTRLFLKPTPNLVADNYRKAGASSVVYAVGAKAVQ